MNYHARFISSGHCKDSFRLAYHARWTPAVPVPATQAGTAGQPPARQCASDHRRQGAQAAEAGAAEAEASARDGGFPPQTRSVCVEHPRHYATLGCGGGGEGMVAWSSQRFVWV